MELCECCKSKECNKNIVTIEYKDYKLIKCLDYVKDESKIKGYVAPLEVTAKRCYVKEIER